MGKVMKAEYIHELVNPLGLDGWELVSFAPAYYVEADNVHTITGVPMHAATAWSISDYRAIFKRKLP